MDTLGLIDLFLLLLSLTLIDLILMEWGLALIGLLVWVWIIASSHGWSDGWMGIGVFGDNVIDYFFFFFGLLYFKCLGLI